MNFSEAEKAKPDCDDALPVDLEYKKPFRFIDAQGNETDSKHGSGAPNLDSKATVVCKLKIKATGLPLGGDQCYVIDGSNCPLGLKP
ncbi:hypothetical protein A2Z00_01565 [Candidatus Gottesmanbacteria bacterium RBG_13_45_10]|uniref:Uncharacterized protein n=1 Tax=Candidatus Gottesmanbacteria bacterium RBG_13_45_10 TaxID=1798370 RepID=A0A1F5ZH59_9BACT|nr:MAG: hypothetical protein A2Z00_01565 [Candidatus Gottesmanbacteria bacterium RBG_13_45_10]